MFYPNLETLILGNYTNWMKGAPNNGFGNEHCLWVIIFLYISLAVTHLEGPLEAIKVGGESRPSTNDFCLKNEK